ncbi:MAG: Ku protein [Casimicrobiaceae bacterium]
MPRALWKGAISFGLVNIPVELYPAEDRKGFSFSMLDKRDFSPVGYKRYSKKTSKDVEWKDIVKGYEYEKGQYVVLSDEDFRRANVKASQTIDIAEFVDAREIPAQFFETPYYLAPTPQGKKVYALFRDALASTGRVAVAQVVIRTTQHLAAVVPMGRVLVLQTLRYADELRGIDGLDLPAEGAKAGGATAKEVALAKRLIDELTSHFKPADFRDTYHQDLMRRIHEKIKRGETHELTAPDTDGKPAPRSAQVIDLAALLQNSLRGSARRKPAGAAKGSAKVSTLQPAARVRALKPAAKSRAPAAKSVKAPAAKAARTRKRA